MTHKWDYSHRIILYLRIWSHILTFDYDLLSSLVTAEKIYSALPLDIATNIWRCEQWSTSPAVLRRFKLQKPYQCYYSHSKMSFYKSTQFLQISVYFLLQHLTKKRKFTVGKDLDSFDRFGFHKSNQIKNSSPMHNSRKALFL